MTADKRRELHRLEGSAVHVAMADGSRRDDVSLISARSLTLWVFDNGEDVFLPVADVVDVWPAERIRTAA